MCVGAEGNQAHCCDPFVWSRSMGVKIAMIGQTENKDRFWIVWPFESQRNAFFASAPTRMTDLISKGSEWSNNGGPFIALILQKCSGQNKSVIINAHLWWWQRRLHQMIPARHLIETVSWDVLPPFGLKSLLWLLILCKIYHKRLTDIRAINHSYKMLQKMATSLDQICAIWLT